ncbi:DNA mismatch repair protein MutT [Alcaligenes pakistanensis]|uniref:DNA mismatch repair protein MutT n=1 Tax=Alcaligenes pakistanensis TaxID=1482717 RepID=A0A8H9M158_9BURK|nr:NUDIX domain-containing protein [Alcaligenes pakistanensis]GHC53134.1 DNA mismatch repair protein MutT [Alcaligenes pakistanensis]
MDEIIRVGCGAVIMQNGQILLLQRVRAPEAGHWGIPGGKVDWMETLEQAVKREIAEEVGLHLDKLELLVNVDQIDADRAEHWVAPVYLVKSFTGQPVIQEPEKHSDMNWFDLDTLPQPLTLATQVAVATIQGIKT